MEKDYLIEKWLADGLNQEEQEAFEKLEDAVAAAEGWVDALLMRDYMPGMKPEQLWECFKKAEELPYIFRDDADTFNVYVFDPVKYAKRRCANR